MSRNYSASQFESAYRPATLGNWEVPAVKAAKPEISAKKTIDGRTIPIVDERGHLIKGAKKLAAFATKPAVWQQSSARWPQSNPAIKRSAVTTMGYKGIQTEYLPTSTVPLRTVEIEGVKEFNYH